MTTLYLKVLKSYKLILLLQLLLRSRNRDFEAFYRRVGKSDMRFYYVLSISGFFSDIGS